MINFFKNKLKLYNIKINFNIIYLSRSKDNLIYDDGIDLINISLIDDTISYSEYNIEKFYQTNRTEIIRELNNWIQKIYIIKYRSYNNLIIIQNFRYTYNQIKKTKYDIEFEYRNSIVSKENKTYLINNRKLFYSVFNDLIYIKLYNYTIDLDYSNNYIYFYKTKEYKYTNFKFFINNLHFYIF